jgi:hypothetical protein
LNIQAECNPPQPSRYNVVGVALRSCRYRVCTADMVYVSKQKVENHESGYTAECNPWWVLT